MNTLLLRSRALTWVFVALLLAPCIAGIVGLGQSSESLENRRFSTWPVVPASLDAVLNYPGAVTNYLNDHFGLKQLLAFVPALKYRFGEGVWVEGSSVVIGKNRLLFSTMDDSISKHQGKHCLSSVQLQSWVDRVVALQQATRAEGATLLVAIAPDKQSIYPDSLPAWMRPMPGGCSVYDEAVAAATAHGIEAIDLRPVLQRARQQGTQPYLKNDHHWNDTGALYADLALRHAAGLSTPLPPLHSVLKTVRGGDLAAQLNLTDAEEQVWSYDYAGEALIKTSPLTNVQSMAAIVPTISQRPGPGITTLVIGDSFSQHGLDKFLLMDANRLIWSHTNLRNDVTLVRRYQPKLVVFEEVERSVGVR